MIVYPGDRVPAMEQVDTGQYRVTELTMSSHTGTHIDAPSHYIRGGTTIDKVALKALIGSAQVLDLSHIDGCINAMDLGKISPDTKRVLIKTAFTGSNEFTPDYPHLSTEAARYLVSKGIWCVGIDSPSIEVFLGDGAVHRILLEKGVAIMELLDLAEVSESHYYMVALPLRLQGIDGAPARIILFDSPPGVIQE
jgi:arylformamidase